MTYSDEKVSVECGEHCCTAKRCICSKCSCCSFCSASCTDCPANPDKSPNGELASVLGLDSSIDTENTENEALGSDSESEDSQNEESESDEEFTTSNFVYTLNDSNDE